MMTCTSCGAEIRWAKTEKGKWMPIDPLPAENGNIVPIGRGDQVLAHVLSKDENPEEHAHRYTSHYATCPNANQHRKSKK